MHSQTQRLCLFLFSLLLLLPIAKPDLASNRAALLALRSAIRGQTLLWNVNQTSPCSWVGVNCENNRVTVIRLSGMALSGLIPSGIFGNLTSLRTLSLRLNALRGPLPSDLSAYVTLRNLYLQGNLFSGKIPEFLYSLHDLVRLKFHQLKFLTSLNS